MKLRTIISAVIMLLAVSAFAQSEDDAKVAKMTEALSLTKDQQVKYKKYLVDSGKEKTALKEKLDKTADEEIRKKEMAAYRAKWDAELAKILTQQQMDKLKEIAAARKK